MPANPHDLLFKGVFSDPAQTAAWLRDTLDAPLVATVDLDAIKLCPGSFVEPTLRARHADLLFRVPWRRAPGEPGEDGDGDDDGRGGDGSGGGDGRGDDDGGGDDGRDLKVEVEGEDASDDASEDGLLLYILFEHQSTADPMMPLRLLRYVLRVWEHWQKEHPARRNLPAVLPLVLFHGPGGWTAPRSLAEQIHVPPAARSSLSGYLPGLSFLLVDLSQPADHELRGPALARLAQLLLKHARRGDLARHMLGWLTLMRAALEESGLRAVELVLRYVLEVDDEAPPPEFHAAIETSLGPKASEVLMSYAEKPRAEGRREGIEEGFQKGIERGRREGIERGMIHGQRTLLLRLAARRFGALPADARARIESARAPQLQAATDALLLASDLDGLIAALDAAVSD